MQLWPLPLQQSYWLSLAVFAVEKTLADHNFEVGSLVAFAAAVASHILGTAAETEFVTAEVEPAVPFPAFAESAVECAAFEARLLMS